MEHLRHRVYLGSSTAAELVADADAICSDERLRRRLLVLARVCDVHFPTDGPPEVERFRVVFRANVRSFNALYWGDEATGALVEDFLRLDLPCMRLHSEACRARSAPAATPATPRTTAPCSSRATCPGNAPEPHTFLHWTDGPRRE